jgi:Bacterial regulatory protein, arsR family
VSGHNGSVDPEELLARAKQLRLQVNRDRGRLDVRPPRDVENLIRTMRRHGAAVLAAMDVRDGLATKPEQVSGDHQIPVRADVDDGGRILAILKQGPMSTEKISEILDIDGGRLRRSLAQLGAAGLIRFVEVARLWVVVESSTVS